MKFKVGDKVKGIKDSIYGLINEEMHKGEIVNIRENELIDIKILSHKNKALIGKKYTTLRPEYFELVEEKQYTYEDLKKSQIGTKLTFENGEVLIKNSNDRYENKKYWRNEDDLKRLKDKIETLGKIIKIEEPEYKTVYESKVEILDEAEKRYLRRIIRPFRDKVEHIIKARRYNNTEEWVEIKIKNDCYISFPYFKKNAMYKGMEIDKRYSLEELGL